MSNVLDENVVILKFDNSDFKKNTEESISSLDKLTDRLHKSNSATGLENLGKAAKSFNLDNMSNAVDKVNKRFSLFGVAGMSVLNNLTNSAVNSVKNIFTALPNQMTQGGWKRAMNIEQAEFLMKGLGVKFDGFFDDITGKWEGYKGAVLASVKDTAFGMDQAAKAASSLLASLDEDSKSAEDLVHHLKAISGVAAVTNSDYDSMAYIFTKVAGQGRMMGEELNQLSAKGFNAAVQIRDYLNNNKELANSALDTAIALGKQSKKMEEIKTHTELTEYDIREMVSAGAISFDIMSKSLEHFFDTAKEANTTFTGSLANVKASLSRMGAKLMEPKLKNLTKIFNYLLPVMSKLEAVITPFTKKIADASSAVTDYIGNAINSFGRFIGVEPDKLFKGFGDAAKKAGDDTNKAGDSVKDLGNKLRVSTKEWQAALDIWYKGTYGNDQKRADSIRKLGMSYENVQGIINKFYATGFDWKKTKEAYEVTDEVADANENLGDSAEKAEPKLSKLGAVFKGIMNFATAVKNVLVGFKNILVGVGGLIKNALLGPAKAGAGIFLSLSEYIAKATGKFAEFSKKLNSAGGIKTFTSNQFNKLPNVVKTLFTALGDGIGWVVSHIGPALKGIKEFFSELSASEGVAKLKDTLSDLFKPISDLANGALETVIGHIRELGTIGSGSGGLQKIVQFFSDLAGNIADFINKVRGGANPFTLIGDGIKDLTSKINLGGLKGGLGAKITDAFDFKGLEGIGKSVKNVGVFETIKRLFNDFTSIVKNSAPFEKLKDFKIGEFLKSLSEKLGEVDWDRLTELGTKIAGLVLAFKAFKDMDALTNAAVGTMGSMSGFFESLGGLSDAVKKRIKIDTFKTVALCIAILIGAVVALTLIPVQKWAPALGGVLAMMVTLTAIVALLTSDKFDAEKVKAVGIAFAGMGASILLLGLGMLAIAKLKVGDMIKAGLAIVAFTGMLVLASKLSGDIKGAGGAFIGLATAVNLLLVAMLGFAALSTGIILKGGLVILGLVTSLALAARIAGSSKPGGFISMATAVNQLIPAIVTFALMPMETILKGGLTVVGLITALAAAARIAGNGSLKGLTGISVTVAVLTASMVVLSMIDTERLIASGSALVGLITSMSIAAKLAQKSTAGILAMAAMLAVLTASLYILSTLDVQSSLATCAMLSVLALSLGGAMAIFAAIGPAGAAIGVGGLAIAIAGVGAILFAVGKLDEKLEQYDIKGFIDRGIPILNSVASGMGQMIGSFISGLASSALTGGLPVAAKNLSKFMEELKPFFEAAKDQDSISAAVGTIKEMTTAFTELGKGNALNGIATFFGGETVDMEEFGEQMKDFAKGFKKFAKEAGKIDETDLAAALIISKITKSFAEVQSSLESTGGLKGLIFGNKEDLGTFGEQLSGIVSSIGGAILTIKLFKITDEDAKLIEPVIKIIKTFAGLELPQSGGLAQGITGNTTIAEFGTFLSEFITSFSEFLPKLRDLEFGDDVLGENGKLAKVVSVISTMIEVGNTIPPSNGAAQFFAGNTTINEFAAQLAKFIPDFKSFLDEVKVLGGEDFTAAIAKVQPLANAVKAMAEAAQVVPETGGVTQVWTGGKDLGAFAGQLGDFAQEIGPAIANINSIELPNGISEKFEKLAEIVKDMALVAQAVPDDKSIFSKLINLGKLKIDTSAITTITDTVNNISAKAKGLDLTTVQNFAGAVEAIGGVSETSFDQLNMVPTGANLPVLAENIKSSVETLLGLNTEGLTSKADEVTAAMAKLSAAAKTKVKTDTSGLTSSGKALGASYAKGILSAISSIRSAAGKLVSAAKNGAKTNSSALKAQGAAAGKSYASGISSAANTVKSAGGKLPNAAKSGASKTTGFRSAGYSCAEGFAKGVKSGKYLASDAGSAIGKAALRAAKAAVKSSSPSKEFMKLGVYSSEGFALGMLKLKDRVEATGYDVGMASINGTNDALQNIIADVNPVITPVLDLSDVESKSQSINSLLGNGSIGVSLTSSINQNAAQSSNINLMNQLIDKMDTMTSHTEKPTNVNTYNISVDGSTNPEEFASRLVRQLKVEMRAT